MESGRPLLNNDIADIYDSHHTGRKARTLPIDLVLEWAESRDDLFYVDDFGHFWEVIPETCPACGRRAKLTYNKYEGRKLCAECAEVWQTQQTGERDDEHKQKARMESG